MSNFGKAIWLEMMYQIDTLQGTIPDCISRDEWMFARLFYEWHY